MRGSAVFPDPRDESDARRDDRNLAELLQELRVAGLGVQVLFATALLLGPVAYHRLIFRRGQKERLVRDASVMAIAGLAAVGLAVTAAVLLITGYVAGGPAEALIAALVGCVFGGLCFAFPLARRR